MQVDVLRSTDRPERLICRAARGDYYDGYVADVSYEDLMASVEYDAAHVERAKGIKDHNFPKSDAYWETEAATLAFIEKQLSRGHFGPWEHAQITFTVQAVSRVTMAQITRHRHLTFDVQSQRYVSFDDKEAIIPVSMEADDHFSRNDGLVDLDGDTKERVRELYKEQTAKLFELYEELVDDGVPKEDARFLLPSGTPVNITMSGNARAMLHVLNLRQTAAAQWEVRDVADAMSDYLSKWMPYTAAWWDEHGPLKKSP